VGRGQGQDRPGRCDNEQTNFARAGVLRAIGFPKETGMYIGGGILGTLLVVALIVYILRRA